MQKGPVLKSQTKAPGQNVVVLAASRYSSDHTTTRKCHFADIEDYWS